MDMSPPPPRPRSVRSGLAPSPASATTPAHRRSPVSDDVERTSDERYIIVNGRRRRAIDPMVPTKLSSELQSELMSARRQIARAQRDGESHEVLAARRRVSDAEVALGERGRAWWEPADEVALSGRAASATLALLRHRAATSSICPSDVAKVVCFGDWRANLPTVRRTVSELAHRGEVAITRGDRAVCSFVGGPVRLRRGPNFPDPPPTVPLIAPQANCD